MSADNNPVESLAECESRSASVEQQMRHLWVPGKRRRLVMDSYDIGYVARDLGAAELAEKNFRRGINLMAGHRPRRSNQSRGTFKVVAACHNLLGIQYLDERRLDEAIVCFDEAIRLRRELLRLDPTDRENEVYLGGALCNRGNACVDTNKQVAAEYYENSLATLRQPVQTCECSYWDEQRQSWWCEQLEALGPMLGQHWVRLAPQYIDNAMNGLRSLTDAHER